MSLHTPIHGRQCAHCGSVYGDEPVFQNYRVVIEIDGEVETTISRASARPRSKLQYNDTSTSYPVGTSC